jgi:hypothetical protein
VTNFSVPNTPSTFLLSLFALAVYSAWSRFLPAVPIAISCHRSQLQCHLPKEVLPDYCVKSSFPDLYDSPSSDFLPSVYQDQAQPHCCLRLFSVSLSPHQNVKSGARGQGGLVSFLHSQAIAERLLAKQSLTLITGGS